MEQIVKVVGIKLQNIKNTINGEIEFEKIKSILSNKQYRQPIITGVYGPNSTSKTSLVSCFDFVKKMILSTQINEKDKSKISEHLMTKEAINSSIEFSFLFLFDDKYYHVVYSLDLLKKKETTEKNDCYLKKESIDISEVWLDSESDRVRHKRIINCNIDYDNLKDIFLINGKVPSWVSSDESLNLFELKINSKNNIYSFFLNLSFFEFLENKEKTNLFYNILIRLYNFIGIDLNVFNNDDTSFSYITDVNIFILHARNDRGENPGAGQLTLDQRGGSISEKHFNTCKEVFKDINNVMPSFIPNFHIELSKVGSHIDENNKKKIDYEILVTEGERTLPLEYQSTGIKKLIAMVSILIAVYNNSSAMLVVDEFDSGIFEYLLGQLLKVFSLNAKGQILFTAHNSRGLEVLKPKQIVFTTINEKNRFIRMKGVKTSNNLRDQYYRSILLGGQDEKLYKNTSETKIAVAFSSVVRDNSLN